LGLSAAIRLDTLWPFAIHGFLRDPLFGSGYATLTKYTNDEFTEAESTDNDFLRTLGETGLFGFITFYGTMVVGVVYLWKMYKKTQDQWLYLFAVLLTAITVGLMVNAVYIDVFVSSKVIETYWMFVGVLLAYAHLVSPKRLLESEKVAVKKAGSKSVMKRAA
jgi:O-antigen ligase